MKRLFLFLLLWASPLTAQNYPAYTSTTVNDFADLIDPATEARIEAVLAKLAAEKGVEFTVVTIDRRADYGASPDIETFATGLFNAWGVGHAERDDGIMLLVAGGDREMRLELGAGYPASYDWLAEDVVDGAILPYFRDGEMAEGIEAGVTATITRIVAPFTEGRAPEPQPAPAPRPVATGSAERAGSGGFPVVGVAIGGLVAVLAALAVFGRSLFLRFKPCPACNQRQLSRSREVLTRATRQASGLARVTTTCGSCGWTETVSQTLSRISDSDSSSSGGSSGGSFGGGSSSGGGASGKW
jgi:uncharacterized protein